MPALFFYCHTDLHSSREGQQSVRSEGSECSLERSVAHAARGGDGRQEGRERGYYHLHRNLNDSLLHTSPP